MIGLNLEKRSRVLYLAPWIDYGGSDKGTLDWLKWLDRSRYELSLATTQPSDNRRLAEALAYAAEVWSLPDLMSGLHMPAFVFDFIATRGVQLLHIMNSRLAYELLPDLSALPNPPRVVVQLHVEEEDRSGYVRLIGRRYGNLVDAFSVSSHHLAVAVEGYDVPRSRIHVIPTGVDAEGEFSPARVSPVEGLEVGCLHVLYPGRLVEQKDPMFMLDVVALAVARRSDLRVHVVGDGPLEPQLRDAIVTRGLARHVLLHPPTTNLAQWFAASDLLLMTSRFEGVPYVLYEAMAMGLPAVVPALPGNRELFGGGGGGVLIEPRDDADAYAAALVELANDSRRREEIGRASRERALGELSVREMARRHEELYAELLAGQEPPKLPPPAYLPKLETPLSRSRHGQPLVSVIVPCFNHGRYLKESIASIRAQTWPELEIIVVDDASTERDTLAVLAELEGADDIRVLHMDRNGGPSRARNAALELVRGHYVLPVDADNILLPDAVERLVGQLAEAGLDVGFVYPNLQYFGNRRDYFEAPAYNRAALLEGNFCDTCSLFDARVFAAGVRFREDIVLGHEDWSLVLDLAAKGIRGEAARGPTVLYRKNGFTRSDLVEYGSETFASSVVTKHPELYGAERGRYGPHAGPALSTKANWAPALSLVALTPVEAHTEAGDELWRRLLRQTSGDFELILRSNTEWPATSRAPAVRRINAQLAPTTAHAVADGLLAARGAVVLITAGPATDLLRDRAFVEKVLRVMQFHPEVNHLVLADADDGRYPLRRLSPDEAVAARPHGVVLRRGPVSSQLRVTALLDDGAPVDSLVRSLSEYPAFWYHHAPPLPARLQPAGRRRDVTVGLKPPRTASERAEHELRLRALPGIPALPATQVRRWTLSTAWMPPETLPLVRHREAGGERRIVTNDRTPPAGFAIEFDLGAINRFQPPGTTELRVGGPDGYYTVPETDEGEPLLREPRSADCRGFLEQAPLPLFDVVELAFHPPSGEWVLVSGPDDPLVPVVSERRFLGFIEPYPNRPRVPAPQQIPYGLAPFVRTVDRAARRHRYGVGAAPPGVVSLELGALHLEPQHGSIAVELLDDRVVTGQRAPIDRRRAARWIGAPLTWRDTGPVSARARATVRRAADMAGAVGRSSDNGKQSRIAGYLWGENGPGRRAIYVATHPVTGDDLLTDAPDEAVRLGYGQPARLGWAMAVPLLTGSLEPQPVDVPWASRFGRRARS